MGVGRGYCPQWESGIVWCVAKEVAVSILVETDGRSRVVLPGHPDRKFLMVEQSDGSLLLEPAVVVSAAQAEYDSTPELQDLLARATVSATVRRSRSRR